MSRHPCSSSRVRAPSPGIAEPDPSIDLLAYVYVDRSWVDLRCMLRRVVDIGALLEGAVALGSSVPSHSPPVDTAQSISKGLEMLIQCSLAQPASVGRAAAHTKRRLRHSATASADVFRKSISLQYPQTLEDYFKHAVTISDLPGPSKPVNPAPKFSPDSKSPGPTNNFCAALRTLWQGRTRSRALLEIASRAQTTQAQVKYYLICWSSLNYFHSCYHNFMTHIVGGHGLCREFQTSPSASDLISPESMFKRDAAPHLIDSDAHVVLFVDSSDREDSVSQLVSQLLPGTRLTVLSCQSHCEQKKPLPATCFDSFVQLDSRHIVDGLDLSGTCIEFEGTLAGRTVRILLDSGASANFIDDKLVHELALPTESMSSHVTVRVADDRTSMVGHSVSTDLTVGTLGFRVTCLPTELTYYDLVLGKPWLTAFNPVVNWKLNAVSLVHADQTHVLLGCQRSGMPEYVISSMEVEEMVKLGESIYVVQLNAVTDSPDTDAYNVPELEELLQESNVIICCPNLCMGRKQVKCFKKESPGPSRLNFLGYLLALVNVAALKYLSELPQGTDKPLSTSFHKLITLHFDLYVFPDIMKKVDKLKGALTPKTLALLEKGRHLTLQTLSACQFKRLDNKHVHAPCLPFH
eukprot:jgi/Botrbrau1/19827/Bobra.0124s0068.1